MRDLPNMNPVTPCNNRVLTFHYRSETEHDSRSNVKNFVDDVGKVKKEW